MKRYLFLMLFLFLIGAQYNVNAQGLTVSDIQNSGCLSETRENRAGDDDEYEENRSIILTKEGNTLKVQLLNYIDNCGIWGFDVIPYVSGGSNGEPYTVSISVNPILGLDRAACVCPYDVSFTLNGLETNSFNFSCYWCEGVVSLTDGEPLVIENSWDDIGVNGLNYKIHKVMHSAKLSDGKAWEGELSIPSELNYEGQKYTVTSIESSAFGNNTKLTSVTIPGSVISIGYGAFSGCSNLANITIPNSVIRIENNAFSNTAWYNNQPDGVVYAGRIAYKCKGALPEGTDITIKDGTYAITSEAFNSCSGLASVTIPGSVTIIGDRSFRNCSNLRSVTISEGVKYIGEVAFRDCSSLESITIPKSITKIADFAFYGCKSLASVVLSEGLTRMGIFVFADCTSLSSITIPGSLTNAREYTFSGCTNLTSVVFSEGVKSIEQSIFFHCNNLSTISIPKSIKSIYGYVFSELSNLADFYCFADSVPKITKEAFFGTPIASATLHVPAGSIEKYKTTSPWKDFGNIVALGAQYSVNAQELTVSDIQDSICKPIIDQTQKPLTIVLTKEGSDLLVKLLYYENNPYTTGFDIASSMSFGSNEVPDSVSIDIEPIIPDPYKYNKLGLMPYNVWFTVHGLEISSFYLSCWWYKGFVELTEGEPLVLEYKIETADINGATYDLLKVMHKAMLKKWQGEGEFRIPSEVSFEGETYKVTCLDTYPFGDKMTKVTIPKTICSMSFDDSNSIFFNPFVPCRSLEWIEVEEDCPLFSSADGVLFNKDKTRLVGYPEASPRESYTVPENVTYIYANAFNYLQHLKNLTIPDAVKELYSGSFLGSVSLEKVKLPSRLEVLEQYLFKNCQNLKSVEIPKGIAFIMNQAFEGCSSLNNITLPEGVTVIMDETFKDCSGLTIINLPQSLTTIERSVFMGCSALQILDIPESVNHIGSDAFNGCKMNSLCIRGALESSCMIRGLFSGMDQQTKVYVPASLIDRYKKIYSGEVLPLEEYVNSVSYTKDQMATIILPTEPDASKGKYYRLDRCEKGKIIFEEELSPKARTPYIIVPKEDFSIDLSTLDLDGLLRDTVSVKGASFIGSYGHEELSCQEGFYIDIIDATPDCQADDSNQRKAIVGALRACLIVNWDDPYNPGGTKGITEKRELVLKDNPNGIESLTPNPSPREGGAIYDLSGRKIDSQFSTFNSQFRKKGLYIQNGVKRVVR